jgi:hypothetical protein
VGVSGVFHAVAVLKCEESSLCAAPCWLPGFSDGSRILRGRGQRRKNPRQC